MAEQLSNKSNAASSTDEAEMSFWEHLEELRSHVVRSAIAVVVLALIAFINRKFIFDGIILAPNDPNFITNRVFCWIGKLVGMDSLCNQGVKIKIINYSMSGQFTTHLYISIIAGIILAIPYLVWEIWRFLKPALKENERNSSRAAVFVISFLFLLGVLFGYYLIVPLTVNFFGSYQVSELVENNISLASFISTVVTSTFASGILFLLPVFVYFLTKVGILTPEFLRKTRKYTIVIILFLAAVITPPDVVSQIIVSIPLYGLFELSIWVASRAIKKTKEAKA